MLVLEKERWIFNYLPALCESLEEFRTADEFVQSGHNGRECRPVSSFLLPAIQHEIVNSFRTIHRSGQSIHKIKGLDSNIQ